jgi:hypothetical protein
MWEWCRKVIMMKIVFDWGSSPWNKFTHPPFWHVKKKLCLLVQFRPAKPLSKSGLDEHDDLSISMSTYLVELC